MARVSVRRRVAEPHPGRSGALCPRVSTGTADRVPDRQLLAEGLQARRRRRDQADDSRDLGVRRRPGRPSGKSTSRRGEDPARDPPARLAPIAPKTLRATWVFAQARPRQS
jgi:hypothetical protein